MLITEELDGICSMTSSVFKKKSIFTRFYMHRKYLNKHAQTFNSGYSIKWDFYTQEIIFLTFSTLILLVFKDNHV